MKSIEWAAGLFEGEGCISTAKFPQTIRLSPRLALVTTDKDVVESFHEAVGYRGQIRVRTKQIAHHKTSYSWTCAKRDDVGWILRQLYPHLGKRRKSRAKEVYPLTAYKYKMRGIYAQVDS